jgi:hypothetical protein
MAYNKLDGDSDAAEAHAKARGKKKDIAKKIKSKCEVCGKGHTNHASYVYKTGSLS